MGVLKETYRSICKQRFLILLLVYKMQNEMPEAYSSRLVTILYLNLIYPVFFIGIAVHDFCAAVHHIIIFKYPARFTKINTKCMSAVYNFPIENCINVIFFFWVKSFRKLNGSNLPFMLLNI